MKFLKIYLLISLSLLMYTSGVKAQFLWHVTHTDFKADTEYFFQSISCSGDNCTVTGMIQGTQNNPIFPKILFWRSTDGGKTWAEQYPGLSFQIGPNGNPIRIVQQIDSLNVVAAGDSGIIVRTSDGGATWRKQNTNTTTYTVFIDIHFSDSLTGIAVGGGPIHTTTDGGIHWVKAPFTASRANHCHSYGNGKFRVFTSYYGVFYTTYDNWQTVDSTKPVFDSVGKARVYNFLGGCDFSRNDTILAYGETYHPGYTVGLIVRSTDAGAHWEKPFITDQFNYIIYTTSVGHDTILAHGNAINKILFSSNNGATWRIDSMQFDTNYSALICNGIVWARNHPLGIFSTYPSVPSVIAVGKSLTSHVESYEYIHNNTYIYPNPASSQITISSIDISRSIYIYDMLGRKVMHGFLSPQRKLTLDISSLPQGIYDVLLDHFGVIITIGKVAVIGK